LVDLVYSILQDVLSLTKMYGNEALSSENPKIPIVELIGEEEVAVMGTSTNTFICDGYPMHNCGQDVILLEKVYLKLLPYMQTHPNMGAFVDSDEPMCPNCASENLQKRGYTVTNSAKYQRVQCMDCGAWSRLKVNLMEKGKVKTAK
jgi:hypothetical protein